jgi:prephenate dehydrogenase
VVAEVVGVGRTPASLELARRCGLVDVVTEDVTAGVREAELVVLAVPVGGIPAAVARVASAVGPGCIVTDVGSVKEPILAAGDAAFPDGRFVAGHPIAGMEMSGPAAARADLFQGANWILTPSPRTARGAMHQVASLGTAVGARIVEMTPAWHDDVFATVSHLPHLVAFALMDAVLATERGDERVRYAAGGLRDFTRVAGSDPEMWRDIFLMNRAPTLRVLAVYQDTLNALATAIRTGDGDAVIARLRRAKRAREEMLHRT